MLAYVSGATWYFETIGLVRAVIGGGRYVVCDNKWQYDHLPQAINYGRHCIGGQRCMGVH